MEVISSNDELAIASLLFQRVFNNIRIERTDSKGKQSWLKVPCVYGQRSRILKGLENPDRKGTYKLPLICFNRTGYSRDGDRLNGLHNEVKFEVTSTRRNYNFLTPVPISIGYELTVIAKYQADIDKIASNFMVFFNNDIYVSCEHPKYEGVKMNNQIVMDDSVSEDHPDELDATQDDVITTTFTFTFKTFLFGGTSKFKRKSSEISTYLSTVLSNVVHEFQTDDEVLEYLKQYPHNKLSTIMPEEVETELSTEISSDEYDDGIPIIKNINMGFYAVPQLCDFVEYILCVDNGGYGQHKHYAPSTYISSESYLSSYKTVSADDGSTQSVLTALIPQNDYYHPVDNYCTLAPYVDRFSWVIDEDSPYSFPENIKTLRCSDVVTLL